MTFAIIMLILAVFFFYFGIKGIQKQKEIIEKLKKDGYDNLTKIETGKYIGGHPDIDESISNTVIYPKAINLKS